MNHRKRILLIYSKYSTFVKEDVTILSAKYHVTKYEYNLSKKIFPFISEFFKLFFYLMLNIRKFDVMYSWFADYFSLLPMLFGKIFKKNNIIIVGGFDAVAIPQINFGIFLKKNLRYWFVVISYKLANYIVPVDQTLVKGINYYADPTGKGLPTGVKSFIRNLKAEFVVIPTGYDKEKWYKKDGIKKEKSVISIGSAQKLQTFNRKGFDFLFEVAKEMPEIQFKIVGLTAKMKDYAQKTASDNIKLLGFIPNYDLPELLAKHKVFVQFSLSEGLPNTLCEAMLCECIPVGSAANGIPYGIGECGFVLQKKVVSDAVELIYRALDAPEENGKCSRQRIIDLFPLEKRKEELYKIIN